MVQVGDAPPTKLTQNFNFRGQPSTSAQLAWGVSLIKMTKRTQFLRETKLHKCSIFNSLRSSRRPRLGAMIVETNPI